MSKRPLTPKQQAFCEEYLILFDVTRPVELAEYIIDEAPPTHGYYTYGLICPLNNDLFYIGKGKGNRVYDHERLAGNGAKGAKNERIQKILNAQTHVNHVIFSRHNDESEAYANEKMMIDKIGFDHLTNISTAVGASGNRSDGWQFLPRMDEYKTVGAWSRECLRLLTPYRGTNRIGFLGSDIKPESEDILFGVFERNQYSREPCHG